jgi:hypothetical protein
MVKGVQKQDRQCTYNVTLRCVYETIIVAGKKISITYCECVSVCACGCVRTCVCVGARALACASARVALLIQHATRRHIVICSSSGSNTFFDTIS